MTDGITFLTLSRAWQNTFVISNSEGRGLRIGKLKVVLSCKAKVNLDDMSPCLKKLKTKPKHHTGLERWLGGEE